jgi:hypothetical protein
MENQLSRIIETNLRKEEIIRDIKYVRCGDWRLAVRRYLGKELRMLHFSMSTTGLA